MTQRGFNPGINIPNPGEAHHSVITALQQIVVKLGRLSSPQFKGVLLLDLAEAGSGFTKNDADGVLIGGNTIAVSDLPDHAAEHETGGGDLVGHDSLTGFVADEHIGHTAVSITGGGILSGGGDISANRTISLAHNDIDHDQTTNFVSDEHVAHAGVTLTAGTGLAGGGDISTNRSFAVDGVLEDLDTLGAPSTDGEFIVATGAGAFAYESGNTARASLGLGTSDSPTFGGVVVANGGTIGQASGPLITFNDTLDDLGINGCDVGIGTNAPLAKLHLEHANPILRITHTATSSYDGIHFYENAGIRARWQLIGSAFATAYRQSALEIQNSYGHVQLIAAPTKGVGICTTTGGIASIAGLLHIDQSATSAAKPVLVLDQADVSEEFLRFIGTSATGILTQSIVDVADVTTATPAGYVKVFVQDDGDQLTDQAYYMPVYTLA